MSKRYEQSGSADLARGKPDLSNSLGATRPPSSGPAAGSQTHSLDSHASSKGRGPTSAMAVIEPGLGSSVDGKGKKGIYGSLERAGTPLHLRK